MSRVALFGCIAALLVAAALPVLAAPPNDPKRKAASPPVVRTASKPAQATRPAPTVRPAARIAPAKTVSAKPTIAPIVRVIQKPVAKSVAKSVAKPVAKPVVRQTAAKPVVTKLPSTVAVKPTKPDGKLAIATRPPSSAKFDRSTRSNLLPAGSPQLALQKGPQALPAAKSSASKPNTVNKIAGAAVGAALIGGGIAAATKPAGANAAPSAGVTGPVRPAGRPPVANLNHPHVKPVARVMPSILGHKNANRPRLPLFVLAPAFLGASWMGREFYVWNRRSYDNVGWVAPIPSCYVGGTVFYRNPWTGDCFSFESAEAGDRFAVGTKVYSWSPAKYASVEDMVDDQERTGAAVLSEPFRIANQTAPVSRAPAVPASLSLATNLEATDCSSCLTAIGPVEVTGGQCSVTISNNCGLPVAFDVEFQRSGQTFCQTKLDAASAAEVIVCTQPCAAFVEARVNLKSAIPKLASAAPFKGCRPHWAALEEQAR
jgi:hypothetical protein